MCYYSQDPGVSMVLGTRANSLVYHLHLVDYPQNGLFRIVCCCFLFVCFFFCFCFFCVCIFSADFSVDCTGFGLTQ